MVLTHTGHTPQQEHESTRAPDGGEGEKAKEGHKTVLVATSKKCLDLRVKEKRRNFCHQHVTSEPDKQHTQPWEVWNNSIVQHGKQPFHQPFTTTAVLKESVEVPRERKELNNEQKTLVTCVSSCTAPHLTHSRCIRTTQMVWELYS